MESDIKQTIERAATSLAQSFKRDGISQGAIEVGISVFSNEMRELAKEIGENADEFSAIAEATMRLELIAKKEKLH